MKLIAKLAAAAVAISALAGVANAQDYNNWGEIDPWGLHMQDSLGNDYWVDPYAYDSQADIYGNVYSSYSGDLDNAFMMDLTPVQPDSYSSWGSTSTDTWNYSTSGDAGHDAFINSIWE